MKKKIIIEKIEAIIENYGGFSTADVDADSSPCIGSLGGNTFQLAEYFSKNTVEAVIYIHDCEETSEYISYEDLKVDVLKEILTLAKKWEEIQENE